MFKFRQIIVLQKIPAFTVNLTYNLEPVYSIILSMFIFSEYKELNFSFCIGIALIIISVVLQTWSEIRRRRNTLSQNPQNLQNQ